MEFHDKTWVVILVGMKGDVLNNYKSYPTTFQVVPRISTIVLTVLTKEYEKLDDGSPYPYNYIEHIESHFK